MPFFGKDGLPSAVINQLVRIAAFQNPEFYKAQAMRFSTFGKPRIVACAEEFPKHIGLPRGCLDEVQALLESIGATIELIDERVAGKPIDVTFAGTLTPEQELSARLLLKHDTGVLAATTAFGKTVVAAKLIASRGCSTLVLVHRRQLLDQWIERLATFLDIDRKQIGQIGAGKKRATKVIDVAVIQSLCRKGIVDDLVADYGHVVVDECHHISAQSFELVARACKARFVLGLSATTVRKDGHHPIIFMQCGPIRYQVDARKQAILRPFDHRVIVRRTPAVLQIDAQLDATTIQHLYADMIGNQARNDMIIDDIRQAMMAGRSPVVLTERKDHLDLLADCLSQDFQNVIVVKGGMGTRQRCAITERLAQIPEDEPRILLSTGRYLGEGFDDARLDTLFLTMPISWRGTLAQYAGRLHRLHRGKSEVVIYDYADLHIPMLARMHLKRLDGYKAIGYSLAGDGDSQHQQCSSPAANKVDRPPAR